MRLTLIPERGRGDIILQGQIAMTAAPAERLDGDSQVLLKTNRVHDMPAIQAKALLTAIEPIGFDDLGQTQEGCGEGTVLASWLLEVPGSAEVIFCTRATDSREILIAVQIKFDLALTPPARAVRLPREIGAHVMTFALHTIQQGMHLFVA